MERREKSNFEPDDGPYQLLAALEPEQLTGAKRQHLPRRYLNVPQMLVLWSLRLYLLFMIIVVIYQLFAGVE